MTPVELEPRLLRSFLAIIESGSLTAAAQRVGRTQSAVSQQLRKLEESLGRPLFRRERQRLHPTPEGRALVHYARRLLALQEEACTHLAGTGLRGRLRFGTPDLYAAYLLPRVLARFAAAYPAVEIELHCARSAELLAARERGELDLVLVTAQPELAGGSFVRREPLVWVAAPEARFDPNKPLPLALLPPGAVYASQALASLEAQGRAYRIACTSDSIAGLRAAVLAGLAVSVLPACAVTADLRPLGPEEGLPAPHPVSLRLYRGRGNRAQTERFGAFLQQQIGQGRE